MLVTTYSRMSGSKGSTFKEEKLAFEAVGDRAQVFMVDEVQHE